MNISREKIMLLCLVMAIVVLLGTISAQQTKINILQIAEQEQPEPEIFTGEYTIIQYVTGWANAIYVTQYYFDGQVLWYLERDSEEPKYIAFENLLIKDGYIEGEQLIEYGYWRLDDEI